MPAAWTFAQSFFEKTKISTPKVHLPSSIKIQNPALESLKTESYSSTCRKIPSYAWYSSTASMIIKGYHDCDSNQLIFFLMNYGTDSKHIFRMILHFPPIHIREQKSLQLHRYLQFCPSGHTISSRTHTPNNFWTIFNQHRWKQNLIYIFGLSSISFDRLD